MGLAIDIKTPSSGAARHLLPEREKNKRCAPFLSLSGRGWIAQSARRVRGISSPTHQKLETDAALGNRGKLEPCL